MPLSASRMEVDRVENIVVNFGWKVIKQEVLDDNIIVTIKKPIPSEKEHLAEASG